MDTIKVNLIKEYNKNYYEVSLQSIQDATRFLGRGVVSKDGRLRVEKNVINDILLFGWSYVDDCYTREHEYLNFSEGLRDYQKRDVSKMMSCTKGFLNRNPMGVGKTVETIRYFREMRFNKVCIIVPKITIPQWVQQIQTWWPEKRDLVSTQLGSDIFITNYEKLQNNKVLNSLKSTYWDCLVLDEAHRIKNRKSKRTIACKSISAKYKVAITGTPVLRRIDDLWSILNFLDTSFSGISYWNFVEYFCKVEVTFWGKQITGITDDAERVQLLHMLLKLMSIHNDISETPSRAIIDIPLEMGSKQRSLYKNIKSLIFDALPENCTIVNGATMTMRLRQTTSYPGTFDKSNFWGVKFEWIKNFVEDNPDEQICVFTLFAETAKALSRYLEESGITNSFVIGSKGEEDRFDALQSFLKGNSKVFIGTIGAIGEGFDGLQKASRVGVFIDRDWSPEINKQVIARLDRFGQNRPVCIYYLNCTKTFDTKVGKINLSKSEDIRRALNNE